MGRKIPGRKHRGVRDPEKQREIKLQSLKGKINASPINPDVQEIPQSLNRLIALKQRFSEGAQRQSKHKKNKFEIKRQIGESDREYLNRVDTICDDIIEENKHNLDFKRNSKTGQIEDIIEKDSDDEGVNEKRKSGKLSKMKKSERLLQPKLTKSQKRKIKRLQKQQERALNREVDFISRDEVKFGEVVHAPPSLTVPRHAAKTDGVARPGKKNLLLKSVIENRNATTNDGKLKGTASKVIDKKGKRKNLPNALRRKIEKQQTEIINAYRMIKNKRLQDSN